MFINKYCLYSCMDKIEKVKNMNIKFSSKELKAEKIDVSRIDFAYMIAIADKNPKVWKQFKVWIDFVDNCVEEVD